MTTSIITPQDERFEGTVIINNEYDNLVPCISAEDFESLKQSIKENELYLRYNIKSTWHDS